ncbi:TPA: hypothetical protein ACH3X2_003583 [Trebouxia sp. C0005]
MRCKDAQLIHINQLHSTAARQRQAMFEGKHTTATEPASPAGAADWLFLQWQHAHHNLCTARLDTCRAVIFCPSMCANSQHAAMNAMACMQHMLPTNI